MEVAERSCGLITASGELAEVAFHEAGHAAVALMLDLHLTFVRLAYDPLQNRWGGGTISTAKRENLNTEKFDIQMPQLAGQKAKESVAGLLAEAKFLAMQHIRVDGLQFNTEMTEFGDLWTMLENDLVQGMDHMIRLEFLRADGSVVPLTFAANEFLVSREDRWNFLSHVSSHLCGAEPFESPHELVVETMKLLDGDDCWKKVRRLARFLIDHGRPVRLEENDVLAVLE
jgi:hypothetical protein